jgi:hypothetical protein
VPTVLAPFAVVVAYIGIQAPDIVHQYIAGVPANLHRKEQNELNQLKCLISSTRAYHQSFHFDMMESDRLEFDKHSDTDSHTLMSLDLVFAVVVARELEWARAPAERTDSWQQYIVAVVVAGVDSTWPMTMMSWSWLFSVTFHDPRQCSQTKIPRPSSIQKKLFSPNFFETFFSFHEKKVRQDFFRRSDNSIWQDIHEFHQFFTVSHTKQSREKRKKGEERKNIQTCAKPIGLDIKIKQKNCN